MVHHKARELQNDQTNEFTRIRVLHLAMELTPPGLDTPLVALDPRRGKIEGSAEALWVRHHPFLFPSE
jgi:hypothetical protein